MLEELFRQKVELWLDGNNLRYRAPKGVLTKEQIQWLGQYKEEIISQIRERAPKSIRYSPLSYGQRALWFQHQMAPTSPAYNISFVAQIVSQVDCEVLRGVFEKLIDRHPMLRRNYPLEDKIPKMQIHGSFDPNIIQHDVKEISEAELFEMVCQKNREPFDLANGPLIRIHLFERSVSDQILLVTIHHIACDGWSMGVILRDLKAICEATVNGGPFSLPHISYQYTDFVRQESEFVESREGEASLNYWEKQLSGEIPLLNLPLDNGRPANRIFDGSTYPFSINEDLYRAISVLAKSEAVTIYGVLLSAFQVLLMRCSGQEDIAVGTPTLGRNRREHEQLVGLFINQVVMRGDLAGNLPFRDFLKRNQHVILDALRHQDYPFSLLVEKLQPHREAGYHPIYQVSFNLLKQTTVSSIDSLLDGTAYEDPLDFGFMKLKPYPIPQQEGQFDLALEMLDNGQGLLSSFRYRTDIFHADTIARMTQLFKTLLTSIVADPDQRIWELPIEGWDQRYHLRRRHDLIRPVNPFTVFRKEEIEQSISSRFEEMVEKFPGEIAVKSRAHEWTYEALNCKANSVANTLLETCKEESERIALLFEHDVDMIAALLAVLKAGKTYVPLDPSYPVERLSYMIEDSRASFLLSNKLNIALAGELKTDGIELINIDEMDGNPATDNPNIVISPGALAYILYTSGSTGKPKGVVQNQRNVLHFTRIYTNSIHIVHEDRLTLISSYSFDAAVMDIFGALLNGATLYPVNIREEGLADLPLWLVDQKISIYHSTPTVYRFLMDTLSDKEEFRDLRMIVLGGEAVYRRDVDLYKKYFSPDCLFVNGLGPTESTVSLQCFVNKESETNRHRIPVGYPVDDTEIFLINNAGVFDDIYGEICIKSPYLTLGYWDKPDMTKEAFLHDPSEDNECLIYRTGDMGRYLPDGSIEFLGRKDFQVKIRGYRIEVGEVETALNEHPTIENSAVFKKTVSDKEYLIACVVPKNAKIPNGTELRLFLQKRLPDYMIPSAFVFRDTLPLTPTNKVDLRSLEHLDLEFGTIEGDRYVAARTPTEELLVEIWSQVLGVRHVGVHDNFFELGGHSLLTLSLLNQMEKVFNKRFPLTTIFMAQTIEEMAAAIMEDSLEFGGSMIAIQANGSRLPLFIIPGYGGSALGYGELARLLGDDQPVYCLQSLGLDGKQAPLDRIEDIAGHFISEIRKVQLKGPYHFAGFCWGGAVAFEIAQQLTSQDERVAALIMIQTFPPDQPEGVPEIHRVPAVIHQLVFAVQGILRHLRSFRTIRPRQWYENIKNKGHIVKEMVKTRDIYRGDRFQLYQSLVQNANLRASRRYLPKPYKGRILFIMPINREIKGRKDPKHYWENLADQGLKYIELLGDDSGSLLKKPHVQALADMLAEHLGHKGTCL